MNLRLTKLESMDRLRDLTAKCLVQVLTTDESADRLKSSFDRIFARLEDKDLSLNESVCLVCELSVKRELKNAAKWLREALDLYNQQLESLGRYHKSLIGEMVGHNEMMRILTRQVELLNEKVDCFTQRAELLERDDEQQFEKISICV
ncbi:hypothetical protein N7509_014279 [Penicillium cosmopolitanum]|uniref:Uncharacterized protein n=1 Tax=Penicillium cosmopolitanum TaxID=1131564 RepID=A0A9W9S091_9EURO|nr:uncharacterized protein N7509_014279 [Penicillium cosmopolitanum]KAJ5369667.1 hypothetical protein N7509_014279 [Penicillium cosmopolitanum]